VVAGLKGLHPNPLKRYFGKLAKHLPATLTLH
jgi:hypothetical protein